MAATLTQIPGAHRGVVWYLSPKRTGDFL